MKRLQLNALLTLLFLSYNHLSAQKMETAKVIAFVNVNVLPMNGEGLMPNQTVLVKNAKIQKIGPADNIRVPKSAMQIDGKGKFLMPGLAEMHAHIPTPRDGDDTRVKEVLFLYLSQGITTIRGMLGDPYHLGLRKQAEEGTILSPRIYTSSPSVNGNTVQTVEEARTKVAKYQADGYDFLKIHPGLSLEVFNAVVATAEKVGIPFSGHVPLQVGIERAIDAGYASIDHLDGFLEGLVSESADVEMNQNGFFGYNFTEIADVNKLSKLVAQAKARSVWFVPTQTLMTRWFSPTKPEVISNEHEMQYMPSATLYQWRLNKNRMLDDPTYDVERWKAFVALRQKIMRNLHRSGAGILLGSDAPQVYNVPGFSIHHELKDMVEAGIPALAVLQSGTANPAKFFKQEGKYGTVEKGAAADLILLEANPLEDISNAQRQIGVMTAGRWLTKSSIDAYLAEIASRHNQ
ncbi:MAG: amidohydrolase family protein [Saprospiraceae bacterium]|nr:amidohydrolase family protein [Saprospiraceae bacterium]